MAGLDDEQFGLQLAQAVENLDFAALRSMMKDRFSFATWNTQLLSTGFQPTLPCPNPPLRRNNGAALTSSDD